MIKRYDIRPRRRKSGNGDEPAAASSGSSRQAFSTTELTRD